MFAKDVGVPKISGVPILFAFNMRADMPEDVVYRLVSGFYKNRDALVKADPGFGPLAKDFVGMQVAGINANPSVPVHPGLAKFLKENKAWNDKWKIAGSKAERRRAQMRTLAPFAPASLTRPEPSRWRCDKNFGGGDGVGDQAND